MQRQLQATPHAAPASPTSRRRARFAWLVAGVGGLLQGCGSGDDPVPPTPSPDTADVTPATLVPAAPCTGLTALQVPNTAITTAEPVAAGTYQPPGSTTPFTNLPAFCRVTATITAVAGSSTTMELWLPSSGWNGRYLQEGNNGFAGVIPWSKMAPHLQRGFVTASHDGGHTSPGGFSAAWAFETPERFNDFAWRSVHEVAVSAKRIVQAYYGQPARYAYHSGASTGGRWGMVAAQRFPEDFNGILAGAAIQHFTRAGTQMLFTSQQLARGGFSGSSGAALLTLVQQRAIAACDTADGLEDGIVTDPRHCQWDPHTLVCADGQDPATCLTSAQADAVAASTAPMPDPVTHQTLFVGQSISSQIDWNLFILTPAYSTALYRMGLDQPAWDGTTFDLHTDLPVMEAALGVANATNPDLSAFRAAGGKLIQYHGWEDGVTLPQSIVQYYDAVRDTTAGGDRSAQLGFYRLFMMPGISHGGSGNGPFNIGQETQTAVSNDAEHDAVTALQAWVERGIAPRQFIATKFRNNDQAQGIALQRPICAYPQQATYLGTGDPASASSFVCR